METESRHVSVFVNRPAADVYRYAADPANLPDWAAGLATGIASEQGRWFAVSPMGRIEIIFAPPNEFGVLDHEVVTPDGARTYNPMRVVPADDGSELIFSVRRRGMSIDEFDRDSGAVLADLQTLARLMEQDHRR
ncbi:MAG: SRPBCC family protein [Microlunatus sp.]|nr:SRPBCC family protein [Microlunatus sp.]